MRQTNKGLGMILKVHEWLSNGNFIFMYVSASCQKAKTEQNFLEECQTTFVRPGNSPELQLNKSLWGSMKNPEFSRKI